jgi:hypothetical protein
MYIQLHSLGETMTGVEKSDGHKPSDGQKETENNNRVLSDLCHFEDTLEDVVTSDDCRRLLKPRGSDIDDHQTIITTIAILH